MRWLECSTLAEPEAVDAVAQIFGEWGQGVAIKEPVESSLDGEIVRIDPSRPALVKTYLPLDERAEERRARLEEGVWHLGQLRPVTPLTVREIAEQDWANAWKEHFQVQRLGERTVVVPSWRAYEPLPDDIPIVLDPGMAFGTGLHPSTRLCLRALELTVRPRMAVLDLGTGSGILGIAAAKLGATRVIALDVEAVAVEAAGENFARNAIVEGAQVALGSLPNSAAPPQSVDLVVANITIRILLSLLDDIALALRPGGQAIFSGILAEGAEPFLTALDPAGFEYLATEQEGDWVAIQARRKRVAENDTAIEPE